MQQTSIGWTDYSANLLKYRNAEGKTAWACVHASEGCRNCYSEALAKRWGRGEAFTAENMQKLTPYFDADEAQQILKSKKIAGKKVFVDDMTDLFGDWVSDDIIIDHFAVFALRRDVTFQVLTKRAERMLSELSAGDFCLRLELHPSLSDNSVEIGPRDWPLSNVHLAVSLEDETNKRRLTYLRDTPAAVRWASIEPMLDHVRFDHLIAGLDGIVIGGESGRNHRELPLQSALMLARTAHDAGLAVYMKQDSGPRPGTQGRIPDDVWAMKEWPKSSLRFIGEDGEGSK